MTPTSTPAPDAQTPGAEAATDLRWSLSRSACLALLAPGGHGRVAATMRAIPVIIPVSFTMHGEDVAFSPGPGEGLVQAIENSVVAFQADQAGPDGHTLWDVHVTGVARPQPDDADGSGFRLSSEIMRGSRSGG